jgi:8-oxo-dGTP pyrophosphatase MutT (NUDIX family)
MAHIHEEIDFVADTYVVNDDAVLLRLHDKYKIWLPPGGHVELDEDPAEAAVREVQEEVGLTIKLAGDTEPMLSDTEREVLVPRFINRHRINESHEHVSFIYFAESSTRTIVQGQTEISDKIKWFTRGELDDPEYQIPERVKNYAKAALTTLATTK